MKELKEFVINEEMTQLCKRICDIAELNDNNKDTIYNINDWITKNSIIDINAYSNSNNEHKLSNQQVLKNVNFSDSIVKQLSKNFDTNDNVSELGDGVFSVNDMLKINKYNDVIIYIKGIKGV